MLRGEHFINSNVRPLRPVDVALGAALVEFYQMIEDGRAMGSGMKLPPLTHPKNEYPSTTPHLARLSIERARRHRAKGNITDADVAEIVARCEAVIAEASE